MGYVDDMQAGRLVTKGLDLETEGTGALQDVLDGQAPCVSRLARMIDQALWRRQNRAMARDQAADQPRDERGLFTT